MELENEKLQENNPEETATSETVIQDEDNGVESEIKDEGKTFSQEQVNELVRKRLDSQTKRLFTRYNVQDKKQLDELVGMAQSYQVMKERYEILKNESYNYLEENAFLKNNINPDKYDDVRAYFKGKGIEFTNENLINELKSHNEWLNAPKETTIKSLGATKQEQEKAPESEMAAKLFGFSKFN